MPYGSYGEGENKPVTSCGLSVLIDHCTKPCKRVSLRLFRHAARNSYCSTTSMASVSKPVIITAQLRALCIPRLPIIMLTTTSNHT